MSEQRTSSETTIEILTTIQPGPGYWQPRVGNEVLSLNLPPDGRNTIIQEAVNILSRCVSPSLGTGQETGLVVGYIQSGKTMSFTTVAALACDNGYRVVILIAGTSQYLLDQSRQRLIKDLRLNSSSERRPWRHIPDPTLAQNSHLNIRDILREWGDPTVPRQELRTILITVMKNHKHLQNLRAVLEQMNHIDSLRGVPILIIDDEGDQAGLNTQVRSGGRSTTYQRLLALKGIIPLHSFLQYTATPQAPLLINIVDVLSPKFAEVISPGAGYIGGQNFFGNGQNLIRIIPTNEIPTPNNQITFPPPSLRRAMRLFFLGASAHLVQQGYPPNRSMMVHPSRLTERHGQYIEWVRRAREGWMDILSQPPNDHDRSDLIRDFQNDYIDLQTSAQDMPQFDHIVARLLHVLRRTTVRPLNNLREGRIPVNWTENPYWILVGGQSMDRGFTVEGLTVTYMPRGPGIGNADSIQQRARFFGYKHAYRGYLRVFLEQEVSDAFRAYVEHEEDVRSQLIEHRSTRRPLSEWRREFFLTRNLRPTRNNIIDIDYWRETFADKWVYPEGPHDAEEVIQANRDVFENFIRNIRLEQHDGLDRRSTEHKNQIARSVPLIRVHEDLLVRFRVRRLEDSNKFSLLLRQIQVHLAQHPDDICSVFLMGGGQPIRRSLEAEKIKELFQGIQYDSQGTTYPGDRQVKAEEGITVQLRNLVLGAHNQPPIAENVPHIAIWIPARIARDIIQQPQGG